MIEVKFSSSFLRAFKKKIAGFSQREDNFKQRTALFFSDPYHPQLKTHKLSGNLKDHHSFSVEYDLRVIFRFISEKEVLFIDIGSHDDVY